jgi:hypothetical protein
MFIWVALTHYGILGYLDRPDTLKYLCAMLWPVGLAHRLAQHSL